MKFEWDAAKNEVNFRKHGIWFEEALHVFSGWMLTRVDERFNYGELRHISLGAISPDIVLVVVHTDRGDRTRLISARRANRRERRIYDEAIK